MSVENRQKDNQIIFCKDGTIPIPTHKIFEKIKASVQIPYVMLRHTLNKRICRITFFENRFKKHFCHDQSKSFTFSYNTNSFQHFQKIMGIILLQSEYLKERYRPKTRGVSKESYSVFKQDSKTNFTTAT